MEDKKEVEKDSKEYGKWDKWEIDCCVDTLIKAEEIKSDAEKMSYVKPLLEKKKSGLDKAIKSVKDIRKKSAQLGDVSEG